MPLVLPEGFPYLYETHCHTREASACARTDAVEFARAHREFGYTGMILTNHNWGGNTAISRELSWDDFLDAFFEPYFRAKEWGDANDFQVFPGYEAGYSGTEFLIYGVDIGWMHAHPELRDATVPEQFDLVHEAGGVVVHAHPYREAFYIKEVRLYPDYVDAVEGINTAHCPYFGLPDNSIFNDKALKYARSLGMAITGGSDSHSTNLTGGGMAFGKKLESVNEFADIIKDASDDDYVVTDGSVFYDPYGGKI